MNVKALMESQDQAITIIQNSYKKKRLSHAYIFEGEAGTKKFETALFFASMLLCESDNAPCGVCHQCKRIEHLTHPNVYVIKPSKNSIKKDDIKLLQVEFSKTALEEGAKIYIIEDADTMNAHAQNSLLKFLEEPHPNIYALLLTKDASKLLPTIISRTQTIPFHRLPSVMIERHLENDGYDGYIAKLAAQLTTNMSDAETFANAHWLFPFIDACQSLYESIIEGKSLLLKWREIDQSLMMEPEQRQDFLDVLIHYQKDIIYGKMNYYKNIIFEDAIDLLDSVATIKSKAMLIEELEMMLELKTRLNHYINIDLAFDNLMLALERRNHDEE